MQGIHIDRVSAWLAGNIAGVATPFTFHRLEGGRSNLTFLVTDANGRQFVLRRPPIGHVLASAHDMEREHRIISAVSTTGVPVPQTLGLCTDDSVNEAPFYVMSFVAGVVLDSQRTAEPLAPEARAEIADHLIDVLVDLHAVDIEAAGLGQLARRDGYIERQLKRWSGQWEKSKTRQLPVVDEVARRLLDGIPVQGAATIAHGDYRLGNCIVDVEHRRVAAVLDWELCTLGDPLADLGYLGVYWRDPGAPPRHNDPSGLPGFPSFDRLVDRYANRSGRDVSHIDYYVAFSSWRLAIISEGVYARYLHGAMGDDVPQAVLDAFKTGTEDLAEEARVRLR